MEKGSAYVAQNATYMVHVSHVSTTYQHKGNVGISLEVKPAYIESYALSLRCITLPSSGYRSPQKSNRKISFRKWWSFPMPPTRGDWARQHL